MSTNSLTGLMPEASPAGTLFGRVRTLFNALAEAKAAADHYESLIARGLAPSEASSMTFRQHFGQR